MRKNDRKKTERTSARAEGTPILADLDALETQIVRGGLPSTFTSTGTIAIDFG